MFSHPGIMVISPIILISLFLVKNFKEKMVLSLSVLFSLALSSFWWFFSFVKNLSNGSVGGEIITKGLLNPHPQWFWTNVASIIVPIILFITFYYYWKNKEKSKRELLFFSPILILNFLFISRLIILVPFFNQVYPDIYIIIFLFFSLYCFFNSNFSVNLNKIIFILLIFFVVISISISHFKTPYFEKRIEIQSETIELLKFVDGKLMYPKDYWIPRENGRVYVPITDNALYNYGIVYHNLDTASIVQMMGSSPEGYSETYWGARSFFQAKDCLGFKENIRLLKVENLISFGEYCDFLEECGFKEKITNRNVCLFIV